MVLTNFTFGQTIISSDTVCVGTSVPFSLQGGGKFTTYAWSFNGGDINSINAPAIAIPNTVTNGNMFNVTAQSIMVYDTANNNYHMFANSAGGYSYLTPSTQRLDFGSNPNGIPTVVDLGNPFNAFYVGTYANMEAIEFVLDDNGVFHAFITNRGIVHWVFGNGLSSPPTQATRIYDNPSVLGMAMQLSIINDNGQWRIFVGQDYGLNNIIRFDIGTDLNNIPIVLTPNLLPYAINNPCYFAIIKENNIWYLFTTTRTQNASLHRYTIGPNLQNNNPPIVNLGNTGPILDKNRGLNFLKSCDRFYLIGIDQNGVVKEYNFNGNISNVPTTQSFGQLYGTPLFDGAQNMKPYWYNDTLWALTSDYSTVSGPTIYRRALASLPTNASSIKYYSSATQHVFNTPGVYDVILYCDQGDPRGPEAFCKQIVVVNNLGISLGNDTALCIGDTLVLGDPNSFGNIIWSTGETTPTIRVHQSGTYWVELIGSGCGTGSDTIKVFFNDLPEVSIDKGDTSICKGANLLLNASGAQTYSWEPSNLLDNPNSSTVQVNSSTTTTYYLNGQDQNGCINQDSVTITIRELPDVKITSETTEVSCSQLSVQLYANGAESYLWSPGKLFNDSTISSPIATPVDVATTFYVVGTDAFGCEGIDSIEILSFASSIFFVPTAFSPNNDGINDVFVPVIYCDFELTLFTVFNRWGQVVFSTSNANEGWDGKFRNKTSDGGVYYWYIRGKSRSGIITTRKGDVTLIR